MLNYDIILFMFKVDYSVYFSAKTSIKFKIYV